MSRKTRNSQACGESCESSKQWRLRCAPTNCGRTECIYPDIHRQFYPFQRAKPARTKWANNDIFLLHIVSSEPDTSKPPLHDLTNQCTLLSSLFPKTNQTRNNTIWTLEFGPHISTPPPPSFPTRKKNACAQPIIRVPNKRGTIFFVPHRRQHLSICKKHRTYYLSATALIMSTNSGWTRNTNERMNERMNERTNKQTNERTEERTEGQHATSKKKRNRYRQRATAHAQQPNKERRTNATARRGDGKKERDDRERARCDWRVKAVTLHVFHSVSSLMRQHFSFTSPIVE